MAATMPTSFRLSDDCRALIKDLGGKLGLKSAAVVEIAVRLLAGQKEAKAVADAMKVLRPRGRPGKGKP